MEHAAQNVSQDSSRLPNAKDDVLCWHLYESTPGTACSGTTIIEWDDFSGFRCRPRHSPVTHKILPPSLHLLIPTHDTSYVHTRPPLEAWGICAERIRRNTRTWVPIIVRTIETAVPGYRYTVISCQGIYLVPDRRKNLTCCKGGQLFVFGHHTSN